MIMVQPSDQQKGREPECASGVGLRNVVLNGVACTSARGLAT